MKKLLSVFMAALALIGCAAPGGTKSYRQISMAEAIAMMEEKSDYIILDVRTASEFDGGHIPGAINIPNESIGTASVV